MKNFVNGRHIYTIWPICFCYVGLLKSTTRNELTVFKAVNERAIYNLLL